MSNEQKGEEDQQTTGAPVLGWRAMVEERYQKIKENAETYPYVWASYIVVYGGFGLWFTYRWRKLRKTEDRVRVLQERLRKLVEAEESKSSAASVQKTSPSADKPPG
ncbi:hypothetical protein F2P56_031862 [Juglans regia]|uniref:Uncharacterized protein LOC109015766 n=2 Tax=Juglans regia TaxID=51240 RepID=A0A2I4HC92_JUGRE|nr:uncharacterized protein LOC109015766 [Juglans regia]XP_018853779.1 uncharacterized protein LOC109015766 [Juglans regia]XP_018853786.1 uncharacterized protein LOC109015766 [Juglans regia]KAF5446220.1 hypothetical protein F2P56_031862 [Juglans regia]